MDVRQLAESRGTFKLMSGPEMLPIGKTIACKLHKAMAGLGVHRHYQVAGEVLGRAVPSLATLTHDETAEVWSYACSLA